MLLRLLMVVAVTGLGLELPTRTEVAQWLEAGRACWETAMASRPVNEPAAPAPRREARPVAPQVAVGVETPVVPAVTDAAFDAVVGRMAETFAAPAPVAFEPVEVGEDLFPGLAFALNRQGSGAGAIEPTVASLPESGGITEPSLPSRGERLAAALRLTGQALNAWASLLRQGPTVASIQP